MSQTLPSISAQGFPKTKGGNAHGSVSACLSCRRAEVTAKLSLITRLYMVFSVLLKHSTQTRQHSELSELDLQI